MRRVLLSLPFLLLSLFFALPALAGNWGENWGTMVWGSVAAVPTMGKLGVLVLALGLGGLAARFIQRSRAAASLLVIGLVLPMGSPVANAGTVSVPNTFVNGTPADADEMNANFDAVEAAVNANASAITGAQSTADAAASSATSAQVAAAAAQSTASGAVSAAGAAQSTASGAVSDAAAAQSTASGAVSDAAAAQSTADGAVLSATAASDAAAAAQTTADETSAELSTQASQIALMEAQLELLVSRFRFWPCEDGVTVADLATGLLWERKTNDGSVHDTANSYTWSDTGTAPDGTVYTVFLPALNNSAFAGHTNWRLPEISELQSIMVGAGVTTTSTDADPPDPAMGTNVTGQSTTCSAIPCLDPRFAPVAGPTPPLFNLAYWSAQSRASIPQINAWAAELEPGTLYPNNKLTPLRVRAVRAGSCD